MQPDNIYSKYKKKSSVSQVRSPYLLTVNAKRGGQMPFRNAILHIMMSIYVSTFSSQLIHMNPGTVQCVLNYKPWGNDCPS